MKVMCAWCNQPLGHKSQRGSSSEVTHGICQACRDYFFTDDPQTLERFLNRLDVPVVLVNDDVEILLANDKALELLNKPLAAICGLRGGEVLECIYARRPGGCGRSTHCQACAIRKSVNATYKTGRSLKRVPAYVDHLSDHRLLLWISTEKVANVVLLRIDEVRPASAHRTSEARVAKEQGQA